MEKTDTFKSLPDHSLLEALPCCVLLQRGGRIVYCNKAARTLIGLAEDASVDRPVSDVFFGAYPGLKFVREAATADVHPEPAADTGGENSADRPSASGNACQL